MDCSEAEAELARLGRALDARSLRAPVAGIVVERAPLSPGQRVEAGAQGEHKLARGYLPVETHSLHWIAEPSFRTAVDRYLQAERRAVGEEIEVLTAYGPFRKHAGRE